MRSVTTDESFSVPFPANRKASETASALFGWCDCPHNHVNLSKFSRVLCAGFMPVFQECIPPFGCEKRRCGGLTIAYEHQFFFRKDWEMFLHNSVGHQAHPAFFQHVFYRIFKELIKNEFPLPPPDAVEHPDCLLMSKEENALRFVAGYNLPKGSHQVRNFYNPCSVS